MASRFVCVCASLLRIASIIYYFACGCFCWVDGVSLMDDRGSCGCQSFLDYNGASFEKFAISPRNERIFVSILCSSIIYGLAYFL